MRSRAVFLALVSLALGVWPLAVEGPPQAQAAVTLVSFTAAAQADRVVLNWRTASEVNTVGYNLYRAASATGSYSKVNSALIPSSGGPVTGGNYTYTDNGGNNRAAYYYRLEEVEVNSNTRVVATASTGPGGSTQGGATATPTAAMPTSSPTPTAQPSATPTAAPTATPRPSPTAVPTPTRTPGPVPTPTPTATATPTPTATATSTPTATPVSERPAGGTVAAGAATQSSPTPAPPPVGSPTPTPSAQTPTPTKQAPTATPPPSPTAATPRDPTSALAAGPASQPTATPPSLAVLASATGDASKAVKTTAVETLPLAEQTEAARVRLPKPVSLLEVAMGSLVALGLLGILASLVWRLASCRRR